MKIKLLQLIVMLSKYAFVGLFLQALTFSLLLASEINAQENKSVREVFIDIQLQDADIFETFRTIESQTKFKFNYEKKDLKSSGRISIKARKKSVADILMEISREANLKFRQVNNNINVNKLSNGKDNEKLIEIIIQDVEITGRVVSEEDSEGLPGVSVIVKGTTQGTVTDVEGNYTISAPEDGILVFSSVGFLSEEIIIGGQSVINLTMIPDVTALEEIVVIGYGEVDKRDITGAVGSIRSENIVRANPVQTAKALQGQVAGVNVQRVNGRPGAAYNINIRGLSSINFSNEPLVVIDGVMGGNMNLLDPNDIQSMDVLKDASSTAIYGSRGANGVIIITTKKGKTGKPQVSYDGYVGSKRPAHLPDMMNAQQFYKAAVLDMQMDGGSPRIFTTTEVDNYESGRTTDWLDLVTSPSLQTSHSLSVGGGSENTTYHFSGGYLNEGGNLLNTKFERYNIKGSIDSKLNDIVKVGFTGYYTFSVQALGSDEALRGAYRARPTGVVFYDEVLNPGENQDLDRNGYAVWMGINDKQVPNPILDVMPENFQDETRTSNFYGNAYIEITPLKGLSFRSSLSTAIEDARKGYFRGTFTKWGVAARQPMARRNTGQLNNWTLDNILTYTKSFGDHNLSISGVQSAFEERIETMNSQVENLPYNSLWYAMGTAANITNFQTNLTERSLLSYMARIIYGFKGKYLLTLTSRWDGASQLSEDNKWEFFPSAAVAWRIGDEEFIQNLGLFSDLKFRVSYGYVGNSSVRPYSTQANLFNTAYDFGGNPAFGFAPANLGNRALTWEKSQELNLGLDFGLFNNRITSSLEFYSRKTVDLIMQQQLPTSTGFDQVTSNVGEVRNSGVEVTLNTVNIASNKFTWNTNINFSTNKNEILELYGGDIKEDVGNKWFVGHPIQVNYYYKFDGIWQLDEADEAANYNQVPGSVKVVDQNEDGQITSTDDRVILGSPQPKWLMGMTNNLRYNNFDFSFLMYFSQGAQFRNSMLSGTMGRPMTGRYNSLNLNYWTSQNPTNDYYSGAVPNPWREAIQYQDASFLRISDITFGYSIPRQTLDRLKISKFRIYAQVINPFLFHNFDGMDPEYNSGTFGDDVPSATYLLGVNLSF